MYTCLYIVYSAFSNWRVTPRGYAGTGSLRLKNAEGHVMGYTYLFIHIYVCIYIYMCIHVENSTCNKMELKESTSTYRMPVSYIYTHIRIYIYTHLYIYIYMFIHCVFCIFQLEGYPTWLRGDWKPPFEKRRRAHNGVHMFFYTHIYIYMCIHVENSTCNKMEFKESTSTYRMLVSYIYIHIFAYIYTHLYTYTGLYTVYSAFSNWRVTPRGYAGTGSLRLKNAEGHIMGYTCFFLYTHIYIYMCIHVENSTCNKMEFKESTSTYRMLVSYIYICTHIHIYIYMHLYTYTLYTCLDIVYSAFSNWRVTPRGYAGTGSLRLKNAEEYVMGYTYMHMYMYICRI